MTEQDREKKIAEIREGYKSDKDDSFTYKKEIVEKDIQFLLSELERARDIIQGGDGGMKEWAMAHPYMTFFLVGAFLLMIEAVLREWARAFGRRKGDR